MSPVKIIRQIDLLCWKGRVQLRNCNKELRFQILSAEFAVVSEELEAECDRREGVREGLLRAEIA